MENTDAGTERRASHGSGSASEPKPSSEPARRYATASRMSANSASSAGASCCGESARIARRPGAHVVKPATISFRRSNSRSCSAGRDTNASKLDCSLVRCGKQNGAVDWIEGGGKIFFVAPETCHV